MHSRINPEVPKTGLLHSMKKTEKRKGGRAESHGIFKMQGLHIDRHLDVGLGRELEASAMTARATAQVESTGICH